MGEYDAVIFDLDGVLLDGAGNPFDHLIREAIDWALWSYDIFPEDDAYDQLSTALYDYDFGAIDRIAPMRAVSPDALWEMKELIAVEIENNQVRREERVLYPDVAILPELNGADIGIVTNNHEDFLATVYSLPVPGDDALMDAYIETGYGIDSTREDIMYRKPNPHYLDRIMNDLEADTALYVGDNRMDVDAATQVDGVDPVFLWRDHVVEKYGDTYPYEPAPIYEIDGLDELPAIMKNGR